MISRTGILSGCVAGALMAAPAWAVQLDDIAYIWRTDTGDGLTGVVSGSDVSERRDGGHSSGLGDVRGITALPDGNYVTVASEGVIRIRSGETASNVTTGGTSLGPLTGVALLESGYLTTSGTDGHVRIRDASDAGHVASTQSSSQEWTDVAAQFGNRLVVSASTSGGRASVYEYNDTTNSIDFVATQNNLGGGANLTVDVLSDGRIVYAGEDQLRVRGADPGDHVASTQNQGDIRALAVTPDDRIVIGNTNGNLRIHNDDLTSVLDFRTFSGESIQALAVQSSGDIVVASLNDQNEGVLRILDGNDLSVQLTGTTMHANGEWRGLATLVPEPGSLALLGLGGLALLGRRRRG